MSKQFAAIWKGRCRVERNGRVFNRPAELGLMMQPGEEFPDNYYARVTTAGMELLGVAPTLKGAVMTVAIMCEFTGRKLISPCCEAGFRHCPLSMNSGWCVLDGKLTHMLAADA